LGKACNPGIRFDLHPLSCDAACAAEAARQQGKFWEYHDALFAATGNLDAGLLSKLADDVGLDRARFDADANSAATKAKVDVDVALGKELKIKGTPTAFLNNKLLSARAMSLLDRLVEHESGQDHD
jgi:protein-disulfide isomerase